MVSGNTADIFSLWIFHFLGLWFRDHLHWWTNSSILKEDSPLLQEHSFSPFTEAALMSWGAFLSHPQPLVESGRVKTSHNITLYSWKLCCYLKMIQKSASELKSVDFHRQFFSGCLCEQGGFHSGNRYLHL